MSRDARPDLVTVWEQMTKGPDSPIRALLQVPVILSDVVEQRGIEPLAS